MVLVATIVGFSVSARKLDVNPYTETAGTPYPTVPNPTFPTAPTKVNVGFRLNYAQRNQLFNQKIHPKV